jgi:hypothetical protein
MARQKTRVLTKNLPPSWLPDWKDKSQYPDPKKTTPTMWAWEFLRRSPAYQEFWNDHLSGKFKFPSKVLREKFGIISPTVMPPSFSAHKGGFFGFENTGVIVLAIPQMPDGIPFPTIKLEKNETALVFNLSLPTAPQLKRAAKWLDAEAEHMKKAGVIVPVKTPSRPRVSKYQEYLRVLDARACGASYGEILKEAFKNSRQENTTIRDICKTAIQLRDHDYRYIVPVIKRVRN